MFKRYVMYEELARGVSLKQWKAMTAVQKNDYLRIHPNSIYAKKIKAIRLAFQRGIEQNRINAFPKFNIVKVGETFEYSLTLQGKILFSGTNFYSASEAAKDLVSNLPQEQWLQNGMQNFLDDVKRQFGE